jgi:copper chaperone
MMESRTYVVPNISCGHCVHTIQTELGEVDGVRKVVVSQDEKRVDVEFEPPATEDGILRLLEEINYPVAA